MNNTEDSIANFINALIGLTERGEIAWKKLAAAAYAVDLQNEGVKGRVTLQRARRSPTRPYDYILRVQNAQPPEIVLHVDSSERVAYFTILDTLFEKLEYNVNEKSIQFINKLIKDK